jgi:hypothetical protein
MCYVPQSEQSKVGHWKERSGAESKRVYYSALRLFNTPRMKGVAAALLKKESLRFVKVS